MARSRVVKPEFWSDEKLAKLSRDARLIFIGLWNTADDYGVTKGHPAWLKSQLFPYDETLTLGKMKGWLAELENERRIIPFNTDGEMFYYIPHFTEHQKVDHPSKQRNPEPPPEALLPLSRDFREDSRGFRVETETETETETEYKQKLLSLGSFGNVKMSDGEFSKLKEKFGEDDCTKRIEKLSAYIAAKGKRYKSHYATILMWASKDGGADGIGANGTRTDNVFLRSLEQTDKQRVGKRVDTGPPAIPGPGGK